MDATVIVTGAGSGIGYHLTCALLEQGYRVAGLDVNTEHLSSVARRFPVTLRTYFCDVTDLNQVRETVASVYSEWQRIDIVVNNACLCLFAPFEEKNLFDTRREFEVNYFGYVNVIQCVVPYMKKTGSGIIWNVSSGVGISGFPGLYGYASTKGAVEALTRTLALELMHFGIHVGLFHPPLTATRSSEPLGVPDQMMADAATIGRLLAKRIHSTKSVVTPDLKTALSLKFLQWFPGISGRLLGRFSTRMVKSTSAGPA